MSPMAHFSATLETVKGAELLTTVGRLSFSWLSPVTPKRPLPEKAIPQEKIRAVFRLEIRTV